VDDVAIGENQSIRGEDEAGAASTALALIARPSPASSALHCLMYFNIHHRRADALDRRSNRARISIEQAGIATLDCRGAQRFLRQTASQGLLRREGLHKEAIEVHAR